MEISNATPSIESNPFFKPNKPIIQDSMQHRLNREVRAKVLNDTVSTFCKDDDLFALESAITNFNSVSFDTREPVIDFWAFKQAGESLQDRASVRKFLTPIVFMKLPKDKQGCLLVKPFMKYINMKIQMERIHIQLQFYDMVGDGYLRESDLENFIFELIPSLRGLDGLQRDFAQFYVYTAVRKFMLFLDPRRSGKIAISHIVGSVQLDELLELRNHVVSGSNWFSADSAVAIYMRYLDMDTDGNGMLAKAELLKYSGAMLTPAVVDRIFAECMTYDGELDYKGFLDLVLALENKHDMVSRQYFWRLIDVDHKGVIGRREFDFFFKDVLTRLNSTVHKLKDVFNEIMDLLGLGEQTVIRWTDVEKSPQGGLVLSMFIDAHAFYLYEHRESVNQSS